jgi:hypothetical protein
MPSLSVRPATAARLLAAAVAATACSQAPDPLTSPADPGTNYIDAAPTVTAARDAGPGKVQTDAARTGASATGADSQADDDCVRGHYTAKARALDMFVLLDQSGSMQEDEDRWTPVTTALKTFVGLPELAHTGVALQYFPLGSSDKIKCLPATYDPPAVLMAELPDNTEPLRKSIDDHYFSHDECCDTEEHSGTPTRPAVEGALSYMQTWLTQHPDHVGVLLLATDGEPSGVCDDNKVPDVAEVLAAAAAGSPQVKSYVIGIGNNEKLDQLAQAGGTGENALIVDGTGVMTEQQLLDALAKIRNEALPCDYPIDNIPDVNAVNVEWSVGDDGDTKRLINVVDEAGCTKASSTGWFYDTPKAPTRIKLCPDTCAALGEQVNVSVRIVEGCETTVVI